MSYFDSPAASRSHEQSGWIEPNTGTHDHREANPLAEPGVGDRESRRLLNPRAAQRQSLDRRRVDVVPAAEMMSFLRPVICR